ncbi:hypothetical protein ES703_54902 [subsurface metagenome]
MSFPEGKKDWFAIFSFIMMLIEAIQRTFFGDDDDGK